MAFFFAFVVAVVCALINLPGAMEGRTANVAALAFCAAMAIWDLVMGAITMLRK